VSREDAVELRSITYLGSQKHGLCGPLLDLGSPCRPATAHVPGAT
jgi:hypothetical protein